MNDQLISSEIESHYANQENVEPHHISHRRKIGAFYTPINVTTALCDWGIVSTEDKILEPCFGGCTFLEASTARLKALGQSSPETNLFGCDIDPLAFTYLRNRVSEAREDHYLARDFLTVTPANFGGQEFDLAIGNPPYIRPSRFDTVQKETIARWRELYGIQLDGRANLWAYFLLHSLRFLRTGGRMAWVLPASFLTAAYAEPIRKSINKLFRRSIAITVAERLFISEGTEETTTILLAEDFKSSAPHAEMEVQCIDRAENLTALIRCWQQDLNTFTSNKSPLGSGLVPIEAVECLMDVASNPHVQRLGDIANIRIGLVTGDKGYFIKSQKDWKQHQIPDNYLRYIAPPSKSINGISLGPLDVQSHDESNVRCWALNCPSTPDSTTVAAYLDNYDEESRNKNATFKKRKVWHYFFDEAVPDGFLAFLTHLGPKVILNEVRANCTNSMYRIYFKDSLQDHHQKLVAISMHSTLSQLSAELVGHCRGSGALKLEPNNAASLLLYLPENKTPQEIDKIFFLLDKALRMEDSALAAQLVDDFLFSDATHIQEMLPIIKSGLSLGRTRRIRDRITKQDN